MVVRRPRGARLRRRGDRILPLLDNVIFDARLAVPNAVLRAVLLKIPGGRVDAEADPDAQAAFVSADRLAGLADGMFGVAMTLLSTTLIVPVQTLAGSALMLHHISGALFVVALSFAICGTYWVLQQRQLAMTRSVTRRFSKSPRTAA
jgi:hypothetical protein